MLCNDNLSIYSGNDDQIVPTLSLGGIGVISVLSNLYPKYVHDMVYNYLNGNINKALNMQLHSLPLIHLLFSEVNPTPIKYAMNQIGFKCGIPRLPLIELSDYNKEKLKSAIQNFNY